MNLNTNKNEVESTLDKILKRREREDNIVKQHYIENPEEDIRASQKKVLELTLPTVLGAAALHARNRDLGIWNAIAAIPIGAAVHATAEGGRRQNILKEKGIDRNLLLPFSRELEKNASLPHQASVGLFKRLGQLLTGSKANKLKKARETTGKHLNKAVASKKPQSVVDKLNSRFDRQHAAQWSERAKSRSLQGMTGVAGITGYKQFKGKNGNK